MSVVDRLEESGTLGTVGGAVGSVFNIAATVTELLGVEYQTTGKSFAKEIL